MAILDEADYRILDILQKDGRITFSDLADQVNLSRSAVRERIKNMQDSGIIRGFTAIIDAKAYEKFASVYMDIEAEPMKINDVAKELMKLNEIAIVSQHTGSTGLHPYKSKRMCLYGKNRFGRNLGPPCACDPAGSGNAVWQGV